MTAFDHDQQVPVAQFDYSQFDQEVIEEEVERRIRERNLEQCEGIARLCAFLSKHRNPRLAVAQLSFAAGTYNTDGKSGPWFAKKFGISKEAFFQGAARITEKLGLVNRAHKSAAASVSYSLRNKRNENGCLTKTHRPNESSNITDPVQT